MNKPLLMLVDDQAANLHTLSATLQKKYNLQFATSGKRALELLACGDKPRLILLDVMMPEMSGLQMLSELRKNSRTADIPVILLTGDNSGDTEVEGLELRADDFLTKPIHPNVLLARVRNVLLRRQEQAQLRLAAHVFANSGEAMLVCDRACRVQHVNPAFCHLSGYQALEVLGKNVAGLALDPDQAARYQQIWADLSHAAQASPDSRLHWRGEIWHRHKDGSPYPALVSIASLRDARGEPEFHFISMVDISEQKANEERMRHLAHHDMLTGLPNRLHLGIHLETALALARRNASSGALMFIDLDRFKMINDSLGHDVGDELLVQVAQRLRQAVRSSDLVARLGGDEFVVVLHGVCSRAAVQPIANKILSSLGRAYEIGKHLLYSSPSIGVCLFPGDGCDVELLIKNADAAMYLAKAQGRNNAQYFAGEAEHP